MVSKGRGRLVRMVVTRYEWWSLGTRRDNVVGIVLSWWRRNEVGYWSAKDE